LDQLYDTLNSVSTVIFQVWTIRLSELRVRKRDLKLRHKTAEAEKAAEIQAFAERCTAKRAELVRRCQEGLAKAPEGFPSPDHPLYSRASRELMDLRDAEKRFAKARDYEGAKSVQRRADQRAEREREAHEKSRTAACKRIRDQVLAQNEKTLEAFDQHKEQKKQALIRTHDKLIESLTNMIQTTSKTIRELCCRARPGTDLAPV
jgi:hypothetical protein